MARNCDKCSVWVDGRGAAHHDPECPEMKWPDGRPRGVPEPVPLPDPLTPRQMASFKIEHPGGWSPVGEEFGRIFKDINETMVRDHIERSKREWENPDDIAF